MRTRVVPMAVLLLLALSALVVLAEAWNAARSHDRRRRLALSTRVQEEHVPQEEIIAGLRRAIEQRDLGEVVRLRPVVANLDLDAAACRAAGFPGLLSSWLDEELARDRLAASRVLLLCDLMENLGGRPDAEGYRRAYAVRMAHLHQLAEEFAATLRRFEPYRGIIDTRGAMRRIGEAHRRLRFELIRADLSGDDDPVVAAAMDEARDLLWDHADRLLGLYRKALHLVHTDRVEERRRIIRDLNRDRPGHVKQLQRTANLLARLEWRGDTADQDVRLFALVTSHQGAGAGFYGVLLTVFLLPVLTAVFTARMIVIGPRSVDPSAETLQNVDAFDLDTESVTRSPSMSTTAGSGPLEFTNPEEPIDGEDGDA